LSGRARGEEVDAGIPRKAARDPGNLKPWPARWSGLVISLHWAAGAVILILLALGWVMVDGGLDSATTFDLYQWHKSLGFAALALTLPRLAARLVGRTPRALDSPRWERRLAALTQSSLYVLTIVAILSGWLVVSTSPLPVPARFFDLFVIPNIAPPDPALFAVAALAHRLATWGIAALIALHVAGALKHHFVDRDDVMKRMLPRWRPNTDGSPDARSAA
jgi:cytochrome b561